MSDVIIQNFYYFECEQNSGLTDELTSIHLCLCLLFSNFLKIKDGVSFLPYHVSATNLILGSFLWSQPDMKSGMNLSIFQSTHFLFYSYFKIILFYITIAVPPVLPLLPPSSHPTHHPTPQRG